MLESVRVVGFRGFEDVTASFGELTALVGRNSSGKSSILQAVRIASVAVELALESELCSPTSRAAEIVLCEGMVVSDASRLCALAAWQQLFTHDISPGRTSLSIDLTFGEEDPIQRVTCTLSSGRNAQLLLRVAVESAAIAEKVTLPARSKHRPKALRDELLRERPVALFVPAFYGVTPREEHRSLPLVNRSLGAGDQSHIVRNLVARLDATALNTLNGILGRTLGATLVSRTSQADAENTETLTVRFKDTNGELELSAAGTGLIAIVALFATLESVRAQRLVRQTTVVPIVLLDEPEAHLHPRLQGDVGEELAKLAREFGFQLALATHSVEMINRLGRSRATLLSVDRAKNVVTPLASESATVEALHDFADLEPFTALNMLASRRILFHEGKTDQEYLEACARVSFRHDDARMAEWRRYVCAALDGSGNVGSAKVLANVLRSPLFPKLKGEPVRAALLLDRDYSRVPTLATKPGEGAEIVECVWSRHSIESLFLDAPVLAGWLAASGIEPRGLEAAVRRAIEVVNADRALEDRAIDGRCAYHRRADETRKALTVDAATKAAREEVRREPWVFHHGRDRAKRLLEELRKTPEGKGLRGTLLDIVTRADPSAGDPSVLVPLDIRALFDRLVPRAGAGARRGSGARSE